MVQSVQTYICLCSGLIKTRPLYLWGWICSQSVHTDGTTRAVLDSWWHLWLDPGLPPFACELDMEPKAACTLESLGNTGCSHCSTVWRNGEHTRSPQYPAVSAFLRLLPFSPLSLMSPKTFWHQTNQGSVSGLYWFQNLKFHLLDNVSSPGQAGHLLPLLAL